MANLSIQLAPGHRSGLMLKNPVITASGTFGYGMEHEKIFDIGKLGAVICKGITLKPRDGNPQPRLVETACGVLNSVGLENVGVDAVVNEKAPYWAGWAVPVIANIAGSEPEEYASVAARLEGVKGIAALEVNISCPNVASGGIEFGTCPEAAAGVTEAVKAATLLPVIVKLSPNVTDIGKIACAVCEAGADALTLINTVRGMAIDSNTGKPVLGNIIGGLSGPAIKPIALYCVYRVAQVVQVPIIGCGGIMCAEDAIEFIQAGASAVQIGTATLAEPAAALAVLKGIEDYLAQRKLEDLSQLTGIAWK